MLRVRFIGTSSGDYEFKPYDLIGEVIKNWTNKNATLFYNNDMSASCILRSQNCYFLEKTLILVIY